MKVLVIGSGAREHAMVWKLSQGLSGTEIFVAPGNPGTGLLATNLPVNVDYIHLLLQTAKEIGIDVTIVGPEAPLALGIVDLFRSDGQMIFGPTRGAARIETSKAFAKQIMSDAGVPTADFAVFDSFEEASSYINGQEMPIVVKADGLAAGKGVVVAQNRQEAIEALESIMIRKTLGPSGDRVVIEECLFGREVSVFGFTDGRNVSSLIGACDYKRARDGDIGPNTGGLGAYSPPWFWDDDLEREIRETIMIPAILEMERTGNQYTGILYGGLIITDQGPKVIEFNARFGDPEAQVILPRLESNLLDIMVATISGGLLETEIKWSDNASVGIVLASEGYPGPFDTGNVIKGLDLSTINSLAFYGGVSIIDGNLVTSGGRVVTVVAQGIELVNARCLAYEAAGKVEFDNKFYRSDIGRVLGSTDSGVS